MSAWPQSVLDTLDATDEVHVTTHRADGSATKPVTVWAVSFNGEFYLRSVYGEDAKWFLRALANPEGSVELAGQRYAVRFEHVTEDALDDIYTAKYARYAKDIVATTITPTARASTLKLLPTG